MKSNCSGNETRSKGFAPRLRSEFFQGRIPDRDLRTDGPPLPSKLIDVTQTSSHVRDGVKPAGPLERLFNATFRNESASRPVENERAWLQRLMSRDATDRSWDWNAVQEIDGHITFDFDGADQSSIANGKKPLPE